MTVEIKDNALIITLPLEEPKRSGSGKTMVVASTRGAKTSSVKIARKACRHHRQRVYLSRQARGRRREVSSSKVEI